MAAVISRAVIQEVIREQTAPALIQHKRTVQLLPRGQPAAPPPRQLQIALWRSKQPTIVQAPRKLCSRTLSEAVLPCRVQANASRAA